MRNLDILVHFQGNFDHFQEGEQVIKVCIDEFSKKIFVFTSLFNLITFAYATG